MSMEADTAHSFWLGKVDLVDAITRGIIKAKGPIPSIIRLSACAAWGWLTWRRPYTADNKRAGR
jgi:hypothetical protein